MLKKTITYADLDGNPVVEDFYFNLTKAEIAEMELSHEGGGFASHLQKIVDEKNAGQIITTFKRIIMQSIGKRSEDGRRFIKDEEIREHFLQSEAYSELFMELVTDAEAAAAFVSGIVPKDMAESIAKMENVVDIPLPEAKDEDPAWIREDRDPTKEELMSMSKEELLVAMSRQNKRKKDSQ